MSPYAAAEPSLPTRIHNSGGGTNFLFPKLQLNSHCVLAVLIYSASSKALGSVKGSGRSEATSGCDSHAGGTRLEVHGGLEVVRCRCGSAMVSGSRCLVMLVHQPEAGVQLQHMREISS
jgi:hypothetical protein